MSLTPLLVAATLLASPGQPAPRRPRVAVLEMRALGIAPEKAQLISEVALTEAANIAGLEVIGRSDIQTMIGFEKEKAMLGCSDDSKCMAEIAGALGVDWILVGSLGQLDALYRLDLKLIDARRSKISGRIGDSIEGSQARLVAAVQSGVHRLLDPLAGATAAPVAVAAAAPPPAPNPSTSPEAAPVSPAAPSRFGAALRLAVMAAGGSPDGDLGTGMGGLVGPGSSLGLDVAMALGAGYAVGLYLDGAAVAGNCSGAMGECSPRLLRAGAQVLWAQSRERAFRWWGSAGTGYEQLNLGGSWDARYKGVELLSLRWGGDWAVSRGFNVGPFVAASAGEYTRIEGALPTTSGVVYGGGAIKHQKLHFWFGLGIRGAYGL